MYYFLQCYCLLFLFWSDSMTHSTLSSLKVRSKFTAVEEVEKAITIMITEAQKIEMSTCQVIRLDRVDEDP